MTSKPQWHKLTEAEENDRKKYYEGSTSRALNMIKSSPGHIYLPRYFLTGAERITQLEVRPSDTWLISYPKCGSTLLQEILWQVAHGVDAKMAKEPIFARSPFVEIGLVDAPRSADDNFGMQMLEKLERSPSPRIIKTHLPFEFLPPNLLDIAKVVYIGRNPMDCCNSYYHHQKNLDILYGIKASVDEFCELFMKGQINYGSYFYHLKSAYSRRASPNLKIVWYEDFIKDMKNSIQDIGRFMAKDLKEDQLQTLVELTQIDTFRNNLCWTDKESAQQKNRISKFIRNGKIGDFKNHFSEEMIRKFKIWIDDNLKQEDMKEVEFVFDLET